MNIINILLTGSVQLLCSQLGDKFRSLSRVSFQHPYSREASYWEQVLPEITSSQKIKQKLRMLLGLNLDLGRGSLLPSVEADKEEGKFC